MHAVILLGPNPTKPIGKYHSFWPAVPPPPCTFRPYPYSFTLSCNKQVCCHIASLHHGSLGKCFCVAIAQACSVHHCIVDGWRAKLHQDSQELISFNLSSHTRDLWSISTLIVWPRISYGMSPCPTRWQGILSPLLRILLHRAEVSCWIRQWVDHNQRPDHMWCHGQSSLHHKNMQHQTGMVWRTIICYNLLWYSPPC